MLLGLDLGYSHVKAVSDTRRVTFASVAGTPDVSLLRLFSSPPEILRIHGDDSYVYGEYAIDNSRQLFRTEDRSWIESELYKQLYYAAIHEVKRTPVHSQDHVDLVNKGHGVVDIETLVTGLPVLYYSDKDKLIDIITNLKEFVWRSDFGNIKIEVNVKKMRVIPQPFGTVLNYALDDDGDVVSTDVVNSLIGVVDIGGKTTNILGVEKLSDKTRRTTSINSGCWDVVRAVGASIGSLYPDISLSDSEIMRVIHSGYLNYYGERKEIKDIIEDATNTLVASVQYELSKLWSKGAEFDKILITGGGAYLIGDRIVELFRQAEIVHDPVFSNVVGYYKFAKRING